MPAEEAKHKLADDRNLHHLHRPVHSRLHTRRSDEREAVDSFRAARGVGRGDQSAHRMADQVDGVGDAEAR